MFTRDKETSIIHQTYARCTREKHEIIFTIIFLFFFFNANLSIPPYL